MNQIEDLNLGEVAVLVQDVPASVYTPSIPLNRPYKNPLHHPLNNPHLRSLDYGSHSAEATGHQQKERESW